LEFIQHGTNFGLRAPKFSCQRYGVRQRRKIKLIGTCGIVAAIAGAWFLWDALATRPKVVRLPDGTTLSFYATTYGKNQPWFPQVNPLKRLLAQTRRVMQSAARRRAIFENIGRSDNRRAAWWFEQNRSASTGQTLWLTTIKTPNDLSPDGSGGMQTGRVGGSDQPQTIGIYVHDCPTNTPTLIIEFSSHKETTDHQIVDIHFLTNITVPNPAYRR
jgi:hypothetical protein